MRKGISGVKSMLWACPYPSSAGLRRQIGRHRRGAEGGLPGVGVNLAGMAGSGWAGLGRSRVQARTQS